MCRGSFSRSFIVGQKREVSVSATQGGRAVLSDVRRINKTYVQLHIAGALLYDIFMTPYVSVIIGNLDYFDQSCESEQW